MTALEKVAQGGLCRALVILGADGNQCFVAEEVVASLGERSPRHDVRAVLLHNLLRFYLLVEYVRLHLIDHRGNLAELRQVDEAVGVEVRHADGTQLACFVGFLHGLPCTVIVVERLVDEQQVDVVGLQFAKRFVDGGFCLLVSGIGNPDFGDDEQFIARHAAFANGIAHAFLVEIGLCRVDHPIAHADGIHYTPLAFRR